MIGGVRNRLWWLTVLVLAALPPAAEAFVLPGPFVLQQMSQRLGGAQRLRVVQTVMPASPGTAADPRVRHETLRFAFPAKFRADSETEAGLRVTVAAGGVQRTRVAGKPVPAATRFERYKDVLLLQTPEMLQQRLAAGGVAVDVSSYGRLEDRIVFVVGAAYPDLLRPQLWVEKDTFLPLRWLMPADGGGGGALLDVRFSGWRKFDRTWYPMRVDFFEQGRHVRAVTVQTVEPQADISADAFELAD